MSITTTELYFEVDEDDEEYKKINSEVSGFIFFFFSCWSSFVPERVFHVVFDVALEGSKEQILGCAAY